VPIYEFRCKRCKTQFEAIRPLDDDGKKLNCPDCGKKAPEKVPATFATVSSRGSSRAPGAGFG